MIGATNRPDILDPAVIRPGRLDQLIYIPLPDLESRKAIFQASLRKAPIDPEVNIEVLARSTHGFSGADISEICTSASKLAIREANLEAEEAMRKEAAEAEADDSTQDLNDDDDDDKDDTAAPAETASERTGKKMLITKRHFNIAMSKARRSVSEKDLTLFEEFAEKQKAGRGEEASNFKFSDASGDGAEEAGEDGDDLYA